MFGRLSEVKAEPDPRRSKGVTGKYSEDKSLIGMGRGAVLGHSCL